LDLDPRPRCFGYVRPGKQREREETTMNAIRSMGARRRIPLPTAILACAVCAALGGGGVTVTAEMRTGPAVRPGYPFVIQGYGYSCDSTPRTPNFSCSYNKPYGPTGTPIMTIFKGYRAMYIQSLQRPTLTYGDGEYQTKFVR
jgi:hypothetical protein